MNENLRAISRITFTLVLVGLVGLSGHHPASAQLEPARLESTQFQLARFEPTRFKPGIHQPLVNTSAGVHIASRIQAPVTPLLKPIPVFQSIRTFNQIKGRDIHELNHETLQDVFLTAYSLDVRSTGKTPACKDYGITFSGTRATAGRTVAVDPRVIPIGTPIYIEGIGWRIAEDTGGAVKGRHIDVLLSSEQAAIRFGVKRHVRVYVPLGDLVEVMATSSDRP